MSPPIDNRLFVVGMTEVEALRELANLIERVFDDAGPPMTIDDVKRYYGMATCAEVAANNMVTALSSTLNAMGLAIVTLQQATIIDSGGGNERR